MGDQQNQIIKGNPSQYVKLNIGGEKGQILEKNPIFWVETKIPLQLSLLGLLYYTTIRTLTKVDCMLRAMFSGKLEVLTGE